MQSATPSEKTPMELIRGARRTIRVLVYSITLFFVHALMAPDLLAIQENRKQQQLRDRIVLTGSPEQKLNQALIHLKESAREKHQTLGKRLEAEYGVLESILGFVGLSRLQMENVDRVETLESMLTEQHTEVLRGFEEEGKRLTEAGVPDIILQRHEAAAEKYRDQFEQMMARLRAVLEADNLKAQGEAFEALEAFMGSQKLKRNHQHLDPDNLPWGTPDADKTRPPAESASELNQLTGFPSLPQGQMLASNVITPEMLGKPGGPTAEDLAPSVDVPLTDAIKAKAEELDHDPVKIYHWVRNNIEFVPSYGSIQGADYTLQAGRGNAFDTASLLIGLLRAANVPARYAYGTVEIPADKVMNWVGGVDNAAAAQQLLGQGGIPNAGLVSGGEVSHIKLEHVWVEAWVDYHPSRGAKHQVGDTWIPLDASFKQYEFSQGEDLAAQVPFDAEGLVEDIEGSATIDEEGGFVQGVDQAAIEAAMADYQAELEDYINNQSPDATVGDVLGTQKIIVQAYPELAAGLPYNLVARTNSYAKLPDSLRHKFRYTLGTEYYGYEQQRLITFEKSLPELAGKKLSLSFSPATEADEEVLASYIPEPDPETGEIDPTRLPDTLPGHLIGLSAAFSVDGEVVKSSDSVGSMGAELQETLALWSPAFGSKQSTNAIVAGEYQAIGLGLQGANPQELASMQATLEQTQALLEEADPDQLDTLSGQALVGDLLHATILSYLAMNAVQDQIQAKAAGVVTYQQPSYGKFSTSLQTSYFFGVPRNVSMSGLVMDVDRLATSLAAKDNSKDTRLNFMRATGARASAMEHLVPEQIFSTEEAPAQGISAVKALALASAEGQKIWTIDQSNVNTALNALSLNSDIKTEIRNAVRAGKVATAHETQVAYAGGRFAGYIIVDPDTGAGAYKIGQGENGGVISSTTDSIYGTLSLLDVVLTVGGLIKSVVVSASVAAISAFSSIRLLVNGECAASSAGLIVMISAVLLFAIMAVALTFVAAPLMLAILFSLTTLFFFENIESTCSG